MAKKHKDIEFAIGDKYFSTWEEAASAALVLAAIRGGTVVLDVVISSVSGARAWGGDDAVAEYKEDPDASVFERLEIRVNSMGRVP